MSLLLSPGLFLDLNRNQLFSFAADPSPTPPLLVVPPGRLKSPKSWSFTGNSLPERTRAGSGLLGARAGCLASALLLLLGTARICQGTLGESSSVQGHPWMWPVADPESHLPPHHLWELAEQVGDLHNCPSRILDALWRSWI